MILLGATLAAVAGQLACFVFFQVTVEGPSLVCEVYLLLGLILLVLALIMNRSPYSSRAAGWLFAAWVESLSLAGETAVLTYQYVISHAHG